MWPIGRPRVVVKQMERNTQLYFLVYDTEAQSQLSYSTSCVPTFRPARQSVHHRGPPCLEDRATDKENLKIKSTRTRARGLAETISAR